MKTLNTAIKPAKAIFDIHLPALQHRRDIPALVVGIVWNHRLVYQGAWGQARRKPNAPVKLSTAFRIASISKVFTATAILQLIERRQLRLTDKPERWIADFRKFPKAHPIHRATIRKLLNHTASISRDGQAGQWANDRFPQWRQMLRDLERAYPADRVEKDFKYSNFGYAILGKIIEAASGLAYDDYIRRYIYRPLKLRSTWTDFQPSLRKRLAVGYGRRIDGKDRASIPMSPAKALAPAAGAISTVGDLAMFVDSLRYRSTRSHRMLSLSTMKQRYATTVKTGEGRDRYGFGIVVERGKKHLMVGHGGGYSGFVTSLEIDPKSGLGAIVLTNALATDVVGISNGMLSTIRYLAKNQRLLTSKRRLKLSTYKGIYRSRWGDQAVVVVGQAPISFAPGTNNPSDTPTILKPQRQAGVFRIESGSRYDHIGELVHFQLKHGKVQIMNWGGIPMRRIPR